MARSCLLVAFVLTALLILPSSHGFGRKLLKTYETEEYADVQLEGGERASREMMGLDYEDAGPNTNTRSGFLSPLPPSPILAPEPTP